MTRISAWCWICKNSSIIQTLLGGVYKVHPPVINTTECKIRRHSAGGRPRKNNNNKTRLSWYLFNKLTKPRCATHVCLHKATNEITTPRETSKTTRECLANEDHLSRRPVISRWHQYIDHRLLLPVQIALSHGIPTRQTMMTQVTHVIIKYTPR